MNKKIFLLIIGVSFLTLFTVSESNVRAGVGHAEGLIQEPFEDARPAYCQILGDRKGCKTDENGRSCSLNVFCD